MAEVCCANCEWQGHSSECQSIKDLAERVDPGEEMPWGECPECGALCYRQGEITEEIEREPELWTVIFHHKHGESVYHVLSSWIPDSDQVIALAGEDYEPDDGDYVDVHNVNAKDNGIVLPPLVRGKMRILT